MSVIDACDEFWLHRLLNGSTDILRTVAISYLTNTKEGRKDEKEGKKKTRTIATNTPNALKQQKNRTTTNETKIK